MPVNCIRLLIVDDEPVIRLGIRSGLEKLPGVEILGECGTGADAIRAITSQPVDLVLLDVQLPDCSGLEVVRSVGVERMPMVIFVTAFDEYAVKAFELNAVDYLLKPFGADRLRASVERARRRSLIDSAATFARQLQSLIDSSQAHGVERLIVRQNDRYVFVAVSTIDRIESASNYVQLYCAAQTYLLSETMNNMEKKLDPRRFRRIHRQHIVNLDRVVAIHPIDNGSYELELRAGTRVPSGRQYRDVIQELMRS